MSMKRGGCIKWAILILGLLLASSSPAQCWGSLTGFQTHQYILQEAYKKLEKDPAFFGSNFPDIYWIMNFEGVEIFRTSYLIPDFQGPGPDADGNSLWSEHYYNPRTYQGDLPGASARWYEALRSGLEIMSKDRSAGQTLGKDAAYLAHYIADTSVPYHINGMPADEALRLYEYAKAKDTPFYENIQPSDALPGEAQPVEPHYTLTLPERVVGPGYENTNWFEELESWKKFYRDDNHTFANWFDPWYWDGSLIASKTCTHLKWEANYGPVSSSNKITGYSPEYSNEKTILGYKKGVGDLAIASATITNANQEGLWGFLSDPEVMDALDRSIVNVYTAWRASFSALRPEISVESTGLNSMNVTINIINKEDSEIAKDVEVRIRTKYGRLKLIGPASFEVGNIAPLDMLSIRGIWRLEGDCGLGASDRLVTMQAFDNVSAGTLNISGSTNTSSDISQPTSCDSSLTPSDILIVEVLGRFEETPDSGKAIIEKFVKLGTVSPNIGGGGGSGGGGGGGVVGVGY